MIHVPNFSQIQNALRIVAHALPAGASVTIHPGDLLDYKVGDNLPTMLRSQDLAELLTPPFVANDETTGQPILCKHTGGEWWLFSLEITQAHAGKRGTSRWMPVRKVHDGNEYGDLRARALPQSKCDFYNGLVDRSTADEQN